MSIEQHLFKEIYVVGVDNTVTSSGELVACNSFEKLLEHLKTKNVSVCSDLRVVHGVLTSARVIPKDLYNKTAFILLEDQETEEHGVLLDSDAEDYKDLGEEVERALKSEEAASFFINIDSVYILYGYELNINMAVEEDDLDDEFIATCLKIAAAAQDLEALSEE